MDIFSLKVGKWIQFSTHHKLKNDEEIKFYGAPFQIFFVVSKESSVKDICRCWLMGQDGQLVDYCPRMRVMGKKTPLYSDTRIREFENEEALNILGKDLFLHYIAAIEIASMRIHRYSRLSYWTPRIISTAELFLQSPFVKHLDNLKPDDLLNVTLSPLLNKVQTNEQSIIPSLANGQCTYDDVVFSQTGSKIINLYAKRHPRKAKTFLRPLVLCKMRLLNYMINNAGDTELLAKYFPGHYGTRIEEMMQSPDCIFEIATAFMQGKINMGLMESKSVLSNPRIYQVVIHHGKIQCFIDNFPHFKLNNVLKPIASHKKLLVTYMINHEGDTGILAKYFPKAYYKTIEKIMQSSQYVNDIARALKQRKIKIEVVEPLFLTAMITDQRLYVILITDLEKLKTIFNRNPKLKKELINPLIINIELYQKIIDEADTLLYLLKKFPEYQAQLIQPVLTDMSEYERIVLNAEILKALIKRCPQFKEELIRPVFTKLNLYLQIVLIYTNRLRQGTTLYDIFLDHISDLCEIKKQKENYFINKMSLDIR